MTTLNRNVATLIVLEAIWGLGAAFITFDILSALIYSLGGTALLVATVSTLSCLLLYLPQLVVPYFQQRIRHPIGGAALGQAVIVSGYLMLTVALLTSSSRPFLLGTIVVAIVVIGLGNAVNYPFYQNLRVRLFPPRVRSKSYSTVLFFAQIATAVGAALCMPLLTAQGGPNQRNYLWCLSTASVLMILSTLCYALLRDDSPPPSAGSVRPLREYFREYGQILRRDRNLRVFISSEWMNWLSTLGSTFLAFYAVNQFGEGIAAPCSFARTAAAVLMVPVAHYVVSRRGPRACLLAFYLTCIGMYLLLVVPPTRPTVLLAAGAIGCATTLRVNYMFHLVAALCPTADKTTYYAITSAAVAPMILAGPMVGGGLVHWTGSYRGVFALACVPLCIGLWLAWKKLKDPGEAREDVGSVPRAAIKRMAS